MTIPDYQSIMLPLLKYLLDEKEHSRREVIDHISKSFKLSDEERKELLPSGTTYTIDNRVGWARTYLKHAGLIDYPKRSFMKITNRGLEVLKNNPPKIDIKFLNKFPEFVEFRTVKKDKEDKKVLKETEQTPVETIEYAYQKVRGELAQQLLDAIFSNSPDFFERLVIDLIIKMGYGGSRRDAAEKLGKSGDGGVDGVIKEDKLGLDIIYLQAKRWAKDKTVGRPEIQKFAGALQGHHANKGIFITTGCFSKEARDYIEQINTKIALIDGEELAQLMIDHEVGVSKNKNYEIKALDSDYFDE